MFKKAFFSLALIGAGALGLPGAPASAAAIPVPMQTVIDQSAGASSIIEVGSHRDRIRRDDRRDRVNNWRNRDRVIRYDRYRHGIRCSRWSNNCRHYYRGYWYANPWWTLPLIGTGIVIGSRVGNAYGLSARHIAWCEDRYRSYNVRSNTWVAYSGAVRQCISPYGP